MRRGLTIAALALIVVVALGYGVRRLWLKSDDLLRPVVVLRDANAQVLVRPSLAARIDAPHLVERAKRLAERRVVERPAPAE